MLHQLAAMSSVGVSIRSVGGAGRPVTHHPLPLDRTLVASCESAGRSERSRKFSSLGLAALAAYGGLRRGARRSPARTGGLRATATAEVAEKWFEEQAERSSSSKFAERGLKTLKELEAPKRNQEPFRYTDLDALLYSVPTTSDSSEVDLAKSLPSMLEDLGEEVHHLLPESEKVYRLVFVDGQLHSGFSLQPPWWDALVGGLEKAQDWSEKSQSHLETLLEELPEVDIFQSNQRDRLGCGKLAALNQAVFRDVAYVSLPEEDAPQHVNLELVFVSTGTCTSPRIVLHVGSGRSLKVIESHLSLDESDEALCNGLCRVIADEDAQVQHEVLQQKSEASRFFSSITAEVASGGRYDLRVVQSGAKASRINVAVALDGEKASCDLKAVMLADQTQQLDLHSLIHHRVPSCRSNQEHKNLVGGSAECIFKGIIKVDAEAQQTESNQIVRSLLLTKKSKVKAMPSLQIQADEVTCAHGAALTQLDPEELFYLASRGLDAANARRLMLSGFPMDLLQGLKEQMPRGYERVMAKLTKMAESNTD